MVEKEMKVKTLLLCSLLVFGIGLVGIGNALGAGSTFIEKADTFETKIVDGNMTISHNGHIVETLALPAGAEGLTIGMEVSGGIHIEYLTKEEMQRQQAENEMHISDWIKIAENDSRVQEIIDGKEYNVTASGQSFGPEGSIVFLVFDVEGDYYKVTLDFNSKTVKSVEAQDSSEFPLPP
jgi:hypothetical protein